MVVLNTKEKKNKPLKRLCLTQKKKKKRKKHSTSHFSAVTCLPT